MDESRTLLSASPAAAVIVDPSGEIVECNGHVEPVLGYAPAELRGQAAGSLFEPADGDAGSPLDDDYLGDPEPRPNGFDVDLHARRADGVRVPVELSIGPLRVDGETHAAATITAVSGHDGGLDTPWENRTRYRRLLDVSPAPIVIYDADGIIRYANGAAADLVDLGDSDGVVGRPTGDFVHPDDHEASRAAVTRVIEDREPVTSVERRIVTDEGAVRHAILSSVPITYDGGPAGQVLLSDVTPLKERERRLERQNDRLDRFAGIVSHDLRNPLTVLESSLQLARETGDAEHFDRADRAVDRMATLVDDLLTMARYGREPDQLEPVSLGRAAREAWQTVETGDASLAVEADDSVRAEPTRLRELLENLFRNAVDHAGDDVRVRVDRLPEGAGFAVADDGPGIPPEERDRVFEHGYSTTDGGTGYGLAIVADLAEAHGWDVTVGESDAGGARIAVATG